MVDLRCGIKIPKKTDIPCQPIRPTWHSRNTGKTDTLLKRYIRLWAINREFRTTGQVSVKHHLNFII